MKQFQINNRPIQPSYTLEHLTNAYDSIEQQHLMAVQQAAETKTAIANMDFNEEEDWYKQKMINDIDTAIEENTIYGNSAFAIDDIIKTIGDINSNPQTIGRLRAQKDYKAFRDKVDKLNIPEDYKQIFKDINKYHYEDKIDSKGKVIGGTKWEPIITPVNSVDIASIAQNAIKIAAKEAGGTGDYYFVDKYGERTEDYAKMADAYIFMKENKKYELLDKNKIEKAVNFAIANTPGAQDSINQDLFVAKYKYDNYTGKDKIDYGKSIGYLNENGIEKNRAEYISSRLNPLYAAASYKNNWYDEHLQESRFAASRASSLGAKEVKFHTNSMITAKSDIMKAPDNTVKDSYGRYADYKGKLVNDLYSLSNGTISNIDDIDSSKLYSLIDETIDDVATRARLKFYAQQMNRNKEYINSRTKGKSKEDVEAFDVYNKVLNQMSVDTNTEAGRNYANKLNAVFTNGQDVAVVFNNSKDIDKVIQRLGGINAAKSYGIINGTTKDGKSYLQFPKDRSNSYYYFNSAIIDITDGTFVNIDENGNIVGKNLGGKEFGNKVILSPAEHAKVFNNYIESLKISNDKVLDGGTLAFGINTMPYGTPDLTELAIRINNGEDVKDSYKLSENELKNIISTGNLNQAHTRELNNDTKVIDSIDTERAQELTNKLRNNKSDEIRAYAVQDIDGQWGTMVMFKDKENTDETKAPYVTIFTKDLLDSKTYEKWNNDTDFIALGDVNRSHASGQPLYPSDVLTFDSDVDLKLSPMEKGFNLNAKLGDIIYDTALSNSDAKSFMKTYYDVNQAVLYYNSSNTISDDEKIRGYNLIYNFADTYSKFAPISTNYNVNLMYWANKLVNSMGLDVAGFNKWLNEQK